ncbi:MAG: DbpA RNA binding domain-containing protein, partial [Gemmatimonadales bacterium]
EFTPAFDAAHRAALDTGKSIVFVCPPAGWAVRPLCAHLAPAEHRGLASLVLLSDPSDGAGLARELASVTGMRPVHFASGTARAARLLAQAHVRTLIATPEAALGLSARSVLRVSESARIIVGWPEAHLLNGQLDSVELILSEVPRAQRIVVTSDVSDAADFLERHAYRAPVVLAAAVPEDRLRGVRYAVVDSDRLSSALRAVLDTLNPRSALLWDPGAGAAERWLSLRDDPTIELVAGPGDREKGDVAVAADLPSGEVLRWLSELAREVIVLVRPTQLAYLTRLTEEARALRLPSGADQARERAFALRERIRVELERGEPLGELLALAPLFDEHDPSVVAAAALRALRREGSVRAPGAGEIPLWAVIRLDLGGRDRIRPADVVGCLVNAVGVPKDCIGRVEVRDTFTLASVRAEWAERALVGLDGSQLRGQRVAARIDRR